MNTKAEMMGGRLKTAREARGLSGKEFAALVGVSGAVVSEWEHGKKTPSTKRWGALADALGISLAEFQALLFGSANVSRDLTPLSAEDSNVVSIM